jgi:preprotein translocase subunit SecA
LELTVEEDSIDDSDLESAQRSIRLRAKEESLEQIRTSLGEYVDPEEPPSQWDYGGLLQWARRAFKVTLSQNQLRKMTAEEIEQALCDAAEAFYDEVNLDGVAVFLAPDYVLNALAEWARTKFGIGVHPDELRETPKEEIKRLLLDRVRESYRERELRYPLEWCLDRAFSSASSDHAAAAQIVVDWANAKYRLGWTLADVQGRPVPEVYDALLAVAREFRDGRLEQEVEAATAGKPYDQAVAWASSRFGRAWSQARFERRGSDWQAAILAEGREMLRWELTRLEQFVLLRLYDQAWKDHLLEMDHLKSAIMQRPLGGDQTHPQSQFAIEGRELFTQMWTRIANRVTDVIFKIKVTTSGEEESASGGSGGDAEGGPRDLSTMSFMHADSTGAGFVGASRDQEAAMSAQNVETKVETIRRAQPRVGRNDPCPCGSGKKFKQCHGRRMG